MKSKRFLLIALCLGLSAFLAHSQAAQDRGAVVAQASPVGIQGIMPIHASFPELPLRRIALFSAGIAHFEHSGNVSGGPTEINFSFDSQAVNDVLKSLVINDPASASPSVRYATESAHWRILRSLNIDLSGMPGIVEILNGQRGAELEVFAPGPIRGRIIGVEHRQASPALARQMAMQGIHHMPTASEAWLSLFTPQGIRLISINDIASFRFIDERINSDLNRALDIILASRDDGTRNLTVTLDGTTSRDVFVSYVIPSPVWKVSYRLDLSGDTPFLQGWAIVDNDSDTDWQNVELSLVIGRPVSFIQNLFHPYHVFRPFVPLSIAGVAEGRTHEEAWVVERQAQGRMALRAAPEMMMMDQAQEFSVWGGAPAPAAAPAIAPGVVQTAEAAAAGDQFLFTLPNPVTLNRRQSAMLPLVEGTVQAERTLIFSGARAVPGATINPELGAELTNTSGMRLPAGPITVYDGGIFAGTALIDFFPEGDRRFITFGEDLSVTGSSTTSTARRITAVNVVRGVMTISRRQSHERVYTIRNASDEARRIVIEHPITRGAELVYPATADDRTATLYRFTRELGARETMTFTVREETPISESVTLTTLRPDLFLGFATNQEIPANVRATLNRAIELRRAADEAATAQNQLTTQRTWLIGEQERTRRNLEAVGIQSPQGQEFLRRLVALDNDIDTMTARIEAAALETQRARMEFENFLATINI